MGQCRNLFFDCGNVYAISAGQYAGMGRLDRVRNTVGDCVVRVVYENPESTATAKMDGGIICRNGVDVVVYSARYVADGACAWAVVYSGGWIGIYDWGDILSVATYEIFTCSLASVRNRGQCVFLFRSAVWMYHGFVKKGHVMPYERDWGTNLVGLCERPEICQMTPGLRCDGCDEQCKVSLRVAVNSDVYDIGEEEQAFSIQPEIYVGDIKLYDKYVNDAVIENCSTYVKLRVKNMSIAYRTALGWCRLTCKHSKMR